jgi:zinc protease
MRLRRLVLCLVFALVAPLPAFAAVKEVISRGGIHAWLVEDHTLPLISMGFSFEGGSAIDPVGKEGLSMLLASLLDEGAGDLDSKSFQGALSERSIALGFSADEDALFGSLKTLSRESSNAFALLRLALHQPRFDNEAIDRMRDALVAQRQYGLSDPNWLASQGFEQVGLAGHPYGRPAGGTIASLREIGRDDLVAAVPQHVVRNRLKIAVVGDIAPAALAVVLDQVFGDLPTGAESLDMPALRIGGAGELALVRRDQPQTVLLAGMPGLRREDPDWFSALVMNYVLGGDFQSRLMSEIRIKRGLTYGISTALVPYKAGGVLYAMASADNGKVAELLKVLEEELHKMAMSGISPEELAEAKTYLTGAFALRFSSSEKIAGVLLEVQRIGLTPAYLEERASLINAVAEADVARMAERMLKPEGGMTLVAVGNPEGLSPTRSLTIQP